MNIRTRAAMFCKTLFLLAFLKTALAISDDPAAMQLADFKKAHPEPVGILTTSAGEPIPSSDRSTLIGDRNLIRNQFFMDSITHFVRERIPERVVHARGAGAFGYFEVTHNITSKCKAKLFEFIGKKTPIAVRFSGTFTSTGGSDTNRESKGFAVKFYTEEGNFDIVGLNTPVFNINDGVWFPSLVHSSRPNPVTNLIDFTSFWDFTVSRPESLFETIILSTNRGTPDGYRYMPGYSVHTYQVVNALNISNFMRFHFRPEGIERFLNASEAIRLAGVNPGYATRDLFNAIAKGKYPYWTVEAQILSVVDVLRSKVNPFDITKVLDEVEFPLHKIGRIVLDKNPSNYFAEIEQLAFCPCNLVPGILGAPDKAFEARRFAYRDAHNHRLGGNSDKIPINCPYRTKAWTYNRDGEPPVGNNMNDTPNYTPNSFNGPIAANTQPLLLDLRFDYTPNLDQAAVFYKTLLHDEKEDVVQNISLTLCSVPKDLQDKVVALLCRVDAELCLKVEIRIKLC